jgi:hypothetical protein
MGARVMISYKIGNWLKDSEEILKLHYGEQAREVVTTEDATHGLYANISYQDYVEFEARNNLCAILAYNKAGLLIGYSITIVTSPAQFCHLRMGVMNQWFVSKPYRGQGIGKNLVKLSELQIKGLHKCDCMLLGQREHLQYPSLPEGFAPFERTAIKWL